MEKEGDFMHRPYTIAELRTIIAPIARKHGVKKVSVFGSVARGEARPDSDIDLCIETGAIKSLLGIISFRLDTESALKTSVDVVTTGSNDKKLLAAIQHQEVVIYECEGTPVIGADYPILRADS